MFRQAGDNRQARFTRGAVPQNAPLGGRPPATYHDRLTGKSGLSLDQVNELGFDPNHSWLNLEEMNQVTAMERQSMQKLQDQQRNIRPNLNTPAPQPVTDGSTMMSRPDISRGGQMQLQPQPGQLGFQPGGTGHTRPRQFCPSTKFSSSYVESITRNSSSSSIYGS